MQTAIIVPAEFKFVDGGEAGTFEGYASVYGNKDSHGDVVEPGAFKDSLAERVAQKRRVPLHLMHGGGLFSRTAPVGVCTSVKEDGKGLRIQGKISGATNTDAGKLLYEKLRDGALPGLSIGWSKRPGGVLYGKAADEPKRRLKAINLHEISLVDDPSNEMTVVSGIKATPGDVDKAAGSVAAAMRMHDSAMKNGGYYGGPGGGSSKNQALMMDHLRDAHEALTGTRACDGLEGWTKAIDPEALETAMREQFGLGADEAKRFAINALSSAGVGGGVSIGTAEASVLDGLASFSMPAF